MAQHQGIHKHKNKCKEHSSLISPSIHLPTGLFSSHFPSVSNIYSILSILIIHTAHAMKPHIMQFSRSPITSSFFGPNILLRTLRSNTLSLCSSLNFRNQVSHPYRTTGKIVYSNFYYFRQQRRRQKFWTEW
jgi:hypothetical protein